MRETEPKTIDDLWIELEDAILSTQGPSFTQNEAAKVRVAEAKAALSAMVAEVLGDDIICDGTCDDAAHAGQKQLLYEQRQRAIAKGFTL